MGFHPTTSAGLTLTLVFGRLVHVGSDGVPYLPFVMLGYSGWLLFSNGVDWGGGKPRRQTDH